MHTTTRPDRSGLKVAVCGSSSYASAPSHPVIAWARSSAYASASFIRPAATICAAHESSSVSRAGGLARSSGTQ